MLNRWSSKGEHKVSMESEVSIRGPPEQRSYEARRQSCESRLVLTVLTVALPSCVQRRLKHSVVTAGGPEGLD